MKFSNLVQLAVLTPLCFATISKADCFYNRAGTSIIAERDKTSLEDALTEKGYIAAEGEALSGARTLFNIAVNFDRCYLGIVLFPERLNGTDASGTGFEQALAGRYSLNEDCHAKSWDEIISDVVSQIPTCRQMKKKLEKASPNYFPWKRDFQNPVPAHE
jgi:hypothetical protein